MEFINDPHFKHTFFKDATRIDYTKKAPPLLINDYGYTYIMLCYGHFDALNKKGQLVDIPQVFIKGTGDYFTITAYENSTWLSFELPNHILYNVTKIHSIKNRNKLIDLSLYVDKEIIESLHTSLKDIKNPSEMAIIADQHLSDYYPEWNTKRPSVEIVAYILNKKGMLPLKELSEVFPYSERTIERIFNKEVGASPYRFICLVRFNYIIRELQTLEHKPLKELIVDYNYFDQSHFEKDFKKFLGQSLKSYKNEYNPLLTKGLSREYLKPKTNN